MTLDDFIARYTNRRIDRDGVYGYQCVDLARQYIADVLALPQPAGVRGAADLWDRDTVGFDKIACEPGIIPAPGDVVIWGYDYGPYGHVAIAVCASEERMVCLSQNDPTGARIGLKLYGYEHVLGWLHPSKMGLFG